MGKYPFWPKYTRYTIQTNRFEVVANQSSRVLDLNLQALSWSHGLEVYIGENLLGLSWSCGLQVQVNCTQTYNKQDYFDCKSLSNSESIHLEIDKVKSLRSFYCEMVRLLVFMGYHIALLNFRTSMILIIICLT